MKPSERRALEAEKRAAKEAEARERELAGKNAEYVKPAEERIEVKGDGYHREGFFGSHVRLITFIICMALILTVFGPWGVDMLVEMSRKEYIGDTVGNKKDISVENLILLSELGNDITWKNFDAFNYSDFSYEFRESPTAKKQTRYVREYGVDGGFILKVGGYDLKTKPDMIQLIDYASGDFIKDIRSSDADVEGFIASHQ